MQVEAGLVSVLVLQILGATQELGSHTQLPLLHRVPLGQTVLAQGSGLQTPLRQVVPVGQGVLLLLLQVVRQTPAVVPAVWTQTWPVLHWPPHGSVVGRQAPLVQLVPLGQVEPAGQLA